MIRLDIETTKAKMAGFDERLFDLVRRIEQSIGGRIPRSRPLSTVGQLIDDVASVRGESADRVVKIRRVPSTSEVRSEAFRQIQVAVKSIGGRVPESIDSDVMPDDLLPKKQREQKWRELSRKLECELPLLWFKPKWAFESILWIGIFSVPGVWAILHFGFGLDMPETWWLAAGFCLGMTVAIFAVPVIAVTFILGRTAVPFDSVTELASHIASEKRDVIGIELRCEVETTIHDFVIDVVAEELSVPREEVGRDFVLVPQNSGHSGRRLVGRD